MGKFSGDFETACTSLIRICSELKSDLEGVLFISFYSRFAESDQLPLFASAMNSTGLFFFSTPELFFSAATKRHCLSEIFFAASHQSPLAVRRILWHHLLASLPPCVCCESVSCLEISSKSHLVDFLS